MGDEIGLLAEQVEELGLVGDPLPSRPEAVLAALAAGLIPVVAPLAAGPLNVNADEAAAQLAVGIEADEIEFVTDVPGLLDQDGVLVPEIERRGRGRAARQRHPPGRDHPEARGGGVRRARRRAGADRRDGGAP